MSDDKIKWVGIKDSNGIARGAVSQDWLDEANRVVDEAFTNMANKLAKDLFGDEPKDESLKK